MMTAQSLTAPTKRFPYRLPVMIVATIVAAGALALLVPMGLAYALSGSMPADERGGIWLFMKAWASFFSMTTLTAWVLWLFSKRAAFIVAIMILAVAAVPVVLLLGWTLVLPFALLI